MEQNRAKIRELERKLERREQRDRQMRTTTGTGDATSANEVLASGSVTSFDALAGSLGGNVGVALGPVGSGGVERLGPLQSGSAWSTIKVPIAARVIEDAGGPDALPVATRDLINRAITASDNAAAASLWEHLASRHGGPSGAAAAVAELLAAAGDSQTTVSTVGRDGFSPYGQTEWPLAAQASFVSSLAAGCVAPQAAPELRSLMGQVVSDQRWGLGATGVPAYFKGGWGPGSDGRYLVRQVGVVERDGRAIAVALAVVPADGQFATGTAAISQLAQWVVDNVAWDEALPRAC
ncbi:MAG: class A beta-lactamase-related serine hydrolase [Actinomycetota bacterium]|nr:class A beta-lactamase-related serine hydrolase [Actinomycetota bacterium]